MGVPAPLLRVTFTDLYRRCIPFIPVQAKIRFFALQKSQPAGI